MEKPKTGMLKVKVLEGCYLTYYRDFLAPPIDSVTHSGAGSMTSLVAKVNSLNRIIGYGSIPISQISGTAASFWIDLTSGGGRVKMDVQFNEFVDPKVP